jgi:hypothetical protein
VVSNLENVYVTEDARGGHGTFGGVCEQHVHCTACQPHDERIIVIWSAERGMQDKQMEPAELDSFR